MRVCQFKMLRQIIGWRRQISETWELTMHDMNERIDRAMILYFCAPWDIEICKRQWRFAQYVCQCTAHLRSKLLLYGILVNCMIMHTYYAYRRPGHPRTKWDQGLQNIFKNKYGTTKWIDIMHECQDR